MRITERTLSQNSLAGLNRNLSEINRLQNQLTSGKAITQPSDSPTGTNSALQVRGALAANAQYDRNMTDGKNWLAATDSTLQSMVQQVQRVRDLTVQAMNTGSLSGTDDQAIADEVTQLRTSLLGLANSQLGGRPLFGGSTGKATAYDANGTYQGLGGPGAEINRRISSSSQVRIDVTGAEAFGDQSKGDDLFAIVGKIATAVTTDPSTLGTQLDALDGALTTMTNALSDIGARTKRLDNAQQLNSDQNLALTSQLSSIEDVDLPKAITSLQLQQNGYQAALSVTAKALPLSLVDFLR